MSPIHNRKDGGRKPTNDSGAKRVAPPSPQPRKEKDPALEKYALRRQLS